jgi:hypothetical protein
MDFEFSLSVTPKLSVEGQLRSFATRSLCIFLLFHNRRGKFRAALAMNQIFPKKHKFLWHDTIADHRTWTTLARTFTMAPEGNDVASRTQIKNKPGKTDLLGTQ